MLRSGKTKLPIPSTVSTPPPLPPALVTDVVFGQVDKSQGASFVVVTRDSPGSITLVYYPRELPSEEQNSSERAMFVKFLGFFERASAYFY